MHCRQARASYFSFLFFFPLFISLFLSDHGFACDCHARDLLLSEPFDFKTFIYLFLGALPGKNLIEKKINK